MLSEVLYAYAICMQLIVILFGYYPFGIQKNVIDGQPLNSKCKWTLFLFRSFLSFRKGASIGCMYNCFETYVCVACIKVNSPYSPKGVVVCVKIA